MQGAGYGGVVFGGLMLLGCAAGDSINAPGIPGNPGPGATTAVSTGTGESGEEESSDSNSGFGTSTGVGSTTDFTTSGAESSDTGAESTAVGSATGDTGDTGETGDPGGCPNATTCPGATVIGGVAGDEPSPNITQMGTEPVWLAVQVSEQSSSVVGEELTVTVTLNTVGTDFDLYAYRGPTGGGSACGGQTKSSTGVGTPESVNFSWGEGGVANNDDDGAFIAIEIVAKDDVCVAGGSWTLTVVGDS